MSYEHIFFAGWIGIIRTAICGALGYIALVLVLRASGKRTLSKMNVFDLVVTVALGSILATITLSKSVALAEGATALGVLVGMQFVVAWLSVRSRTISDLVKAEPSLLFHRGQWLRDAMKRERVGEAEIRAAVRGAGHIDLDKIEAVVLETDGSFSVLLAAASSNNSALSNVSCFSPSEIT